MVYTKYLVKPADTFHPEDFPKIVEELDTICSQVDSAPYQFNTEMMVSFLKDGSIRQDWVAAYPQTATMLTGGVLMTADMEALIQSSAHNPLFLHQLEAYILSRCNPA